MSLSSIIAELVESIPDEQRRAVLRRTRAGDDETHAELERVPAELRPVLWSVEPASDAWILGFNPLDAAGVLREKAVLDTLLEKGELAVEPGEPPWWKKTWWPFLTDGAGQNVCWDEETGEVIEFLHDDPRRAILAESVTAYFEQLLAGVTTGTVSWQEHLGWITADERRELEDYHQRVQQKKAGPTVPRWQTALWFILLTLLIITVIVYLESTR